MELDYAIVNTLLAALTALILAGIAYMNKTRTDAAVATQASNATIAATNTTLAAQAAPVAVNVNVPAQYVPKDTRARDAQGNLTTDIKGGNQFWMDKDYKGPEPSYEVKKAYDSLMGYNAALTNQVEGFADKSGAENLNPDVAKLIPK